MAPLNNRDPNGNLLAESWRQMEKATPELAKLVQKAVDKGKSKSPCVYLGF